jgi:tryptophan halogenase
MKQVIKDIAIIGSGIELHMSAGILSVALKAFGIKIVALDLPSTKPSPLVETTGPEFSALCKILGLVERDVLRQCHGTFRLGNRYITPHNDWFVPFAHLGLKAQQDDFEQGLFQVIRQQNVSDLNPWSVAASVAMAGKFAIAGNDRPDLQQALDYGVQLATKEYAIILAQTHRKLGVQWLPLSTAELSVEHDDIGNISQISAGGHHVTADFWFDLRVGQTQHDWQDCSNELPLTYRAQWHLAKPEVLLPYSQLQRLQGGWIKTSPLRNGRVIQAFAQQQKSDLVQIEQQIAKLALAPPNQAIQWTPVKCHLLNSPWQGNCLYLGKAAIELGGIAFSNLQCVQSALVQFIDLFPDLPIGEYNRQHYNRMWQGFVQDALDYTVAHFLPQSAHFAQQPSSLPDSLLHRLQLFERLGRLGPMHSDAVTEGQWYHLLFGLGLRPQVNSVVLSNMTEQQLQAATKQVAQSIASLVTGMPTQEQYLARFYPPVSLQSYE